MKEKSVQRLVGKIRGRFTSVCVGGRVFNAHQVSLEDGILSFRDRHSGFRSHKVSLSMVDFIQVGRAYRLRHSN